MKSLDETAELNALCSDKAMSIELVPEVDAENYGADYGWVSGSVTSRHAGNDELCFEDSNFQVW